MDYYREVIMRYDHLLRSAVYCVSTALLFSIAMSSESFAAPPENSQSNAPMVLETMGIYWAEHVEKPA